MNKITIIGGMGPQASLELHRRIIFNAVLQGAVNGDDFPRINHLSLPVNDFINSKDRSHALNFIKRQLESLYLWRRRTNSFSL